MKTSIPSIIHYCWMSNDPWDDKTNMCFNSWKKFIPTFEYKLWNSKTLPLEVLNIPSVQNALKAKKWAFVADYVRIWALYNYGGLYMDLDVELIKSPSDLFNNQIIFGLEKDQIGAHFIASTPKNEFIGYVLEKLKDKKNFMPLPQYISECYVDFFNRKITAGVFNEVTIYPNDYFNPFFWNKESQEGKLNITHNTYCVHWYAGSWIPKYKKTKIYKLLIQILNYTRILKILRKLRGY